VIRSRGLAAAVAVAAVASACGGGSTALDGLSTTTTTAAVSTTAPPPDTTAAAPAPTTTETPDTTTTAAVTTTAMAVTNTADPTTTSPACVGGSIPVDVSVTIPAEVGDFDGDGANDTLMAFAVGDPTVGGAWWVRIEFARGGSTSAQMVDGFLTAAHPALLPGIDINGDGRDEFLVNVGGTGTEATILGLYEVSGCTIHRLALPGSPPGTLTDTFTITFGYSCLDSDGDGITDIFSNLSGDFLGVEVSYTITRHNYSLAGGLLVDRGTEVFTSPVGVPIPGPGPESCRSAIGT